VDNVLTAIFCTVVAFFGGVIVAQTTIPEHFHTIEWGSVAEWVAGIAAVATAIIAWAALRSWRDQMRGTSRHAAAAEIAETARLTKYHFYDARSPLYEQWEFPPDYDVLTQHGRDDEAKAWAHLFTNRFRGLAEQVNRLATLRAKAGALLNEECAAALEELARKARSLRYMFQQKVEHRRVGPDIVAQWPDQAWVKQVDQSVEVNPQNHTDAFSIDFEARYAALMSLVKPFI
jgi:hypothetical protein